MENLTLDFNDEAFFSQSISCVTDLCVGKEGMTKISTGDKLINSFHVNPDDFEVFL